MSFKTSYSQNSTYVSCPKHWYYLYEQRIKSDVEAASLFFGKAVDSAVMAMLEGKPDFINVFKDRWHKAFEFGKATPIFDNPNVVYGHHDFDEHVLSDKDKAQLLLWAAELNVGESADGVEVFKEVAKIKKNPYKKTTPNQLKFFNRASWLSLKRKGEILIDSFHKQFFPKIKKVLATQKKAYIKDEVTGDTITGYIDMVVEIEGYDKPIIFDLKTAGQPYTQDQIDLTEQLTLYSAMKSNEYNTDLVGYVVLCKNIPKDTEYYCTKCNHKKEGKHKTCNNMVNAVEPNQKPVRCEGEWKSKKVLKPEVQVLVEKKSDQQINELLQDYGNIILAMKNKIIYRNTSKCHNWYGGKCVFYDLCHHGDMKGLVKKADK